MAGYDTFLDWDSIRAVQGTGAEIDFTAIESKTAYALGKLTEEQVTFYHDRSIELIQSLKSIVDPTGVGALKGMFITLDGAVARVDGLYRSEPNLIQRAIYADYLSYIYEKAREAYRGRNPALETLGAAKDAIVDGAKTAAAIGALTSALLLIGFGYLMIRLADSGAAKEVARAVVTR